MKRLSLAIILLSSLSVVQAQEKQSILSKIHPDVQYTRPGDKTGLNQFETTKDEVIPYEGLKVRFGGNFSQQFQSLSHSNSGAVALYPRLAPGFGIAQANLVMDVHCMMVLN